MNLSEAQGERRARGELALEAAIDARLDEAGLKLGTANVSPADRKKLSGILARLATKAHPFTTCMSDLREHHPEWSDDRRKRTCNVLKALIGRKNGGAAKASAGLSFSDDGCPLIDDATVALLELANTEVINSECFAAYGVAPATVKKAWSSYQKPSHLVGGSIHKIHSGHIVVHAKGKKHKVPMIVHGKFVRFGTSTPMASDGETKAA